MKKEQLYKISNYLITGMIIFSIAIVLLAAFSIIPYYPHRLETIFNKLAGLIVLIWVLGILTIGLSYLFLVPDSLKLIKEKFTKKKEVVKEKDETNVKVEEKEVIVEVVEEIKEQEERERIAREIYTKEKESNV